MSSPIAFSTFSPETTYYQDDTPSHSQIQIESTEHVPLDFNFSVKPGELEKEWVDLPLAIFNASKLLANARLVQDDLKRRLSVQRTDMDTAIRKSSPANFGLDKMTETTIASLVNSNSAVQELEALVIKAKHSIDIAFAAVAAMSAKRDALNAIIEMKKMNYYATR